MGLLGPDVKFAVKKTYLQLITLESMGYHMHARPNTIDSDANVFSDVLTLCTVYLVCVLCV